MKLELELVDIHFWILHIIFTFGIIGGLLYRTSTILQGSVTEFAGTSKVDSLNRWGKFWYFVAKFFKTFFSRQFGPIVKAIIFDSILHVKLFKENRLKWFAHTCVFWGILVLFILSILSGIAVEFAPLLGYKTGTSVFLDALANKDHWLTAILNELLNTVILIGIIVAFIRGFISKKKIGMMMFQDIFLIIFVFVILISGWFTESVRYIIERTPEYIGKTGFFGFYLGRLLNNGFPGTSEAAWVQIYKAFWHIHVTAIWLAFVYIPFSKFAHAILSPVAGVINVMEKRKAQNGHS
jgi:nitrate reductase gamma subunit